MSEKTKNYIILNENGIHEYNIVVTGSITKLLTSNNTCWCEDARNIFLMELVDNGDSIMLDKKYQSLEYDTALYLRLLLSFNSCSSSNTIAKYKVIEDIGIDI